MQRARVIAILFVLFLCTLAPQWVAIVRGASWSLKPLHLGAVGFVVAFSVLSHGLSLTAGYVRLARLFYVFFALYLLFVALPHGFNPAPHFPTRELARLFVYSSISLWVGGLFLAVGDERVQRVLVWSCPWVLLTFAVSVGISLAAQGIDPIATTIAAIKQADPGLILWRLYRYAFALDPGADVYAAANLRHGIMSTLLTGALLTLACRPSSGASRNGLGSLVVKTSVALSFVVVVLSLSRSAILMCVLIAAVWAIVQITRERIHMTGIYVATVLPVVILLLAVSPVGDLMFVNLFERTESYEGRLESMSTAMDLVGDSPFTGVANPYFDRNAHNLLIDALAGGGMPASAAALGMLLVVVSIWLRTFARLLQRNAWLLEVRGEFVLGLGTIAIVRFMTASRGTLHLIEWVALAAFLGMCAANEIALQRARVQPLADGRRTTRRPLAVARGIGHTPARR